MAYELPELLDALNSVTAIPLVPFRSGKVDYDGHAKNIEYLMKCNYLDNDRPRVISVAGTSLIHHIDADAQCQVYDITGQVMGEKGVLMSAIVPNPIQTAHEIVARQAAFDRPPDVYLVMPLSGTASPEGVYQHFMEFGKRHGEESGARFLYYFRQTRDREAVVRLLNDSPHFVGVKIGTGVEDVQPMIDAVGDNAMVIWGIGDRSTAAAKKGAKGHTSGTAVLCARAADLINNAQRRGDYDAALAVEAELDALEELRFMNGRAYNYSAVHEAIRQSGFTDIEAGDGSGPFNPPVPPEIVPKVKAAIQGLLEYH